LTHQQEVAISDKIAPHSRRGRMRGMTRAEGTSQRTWEGSGSQGLAESAGREVSFGGFDSAAYR
jgi:hypothetical protein